MHDHVITLGKFLVLFAMFVAFVPGVVLNVTGGSKDPLFPIVIHGFAFALVYSILSYVYWFHVKNERMEKHRYMNQLLMEEAEAARMERLEAAVNGLVAANK